MSLSPDTKGLVELDEFEGEIKGMVDPLLIIVAAEF